jgi:hypothetical protein
MNHNHNNNTEAYHRLIDKITQVTKNNKSINSDQQNRETISNNTFYADQGIKQNNYNQKSNNSNDFAEKQKIYEKMNQKLKNNRRNAEWGQNQSFNNDTNNNGKTIINRNEIDKEKVFFDNSTGYPLGGGKNAPIVKILNQKNQEYQYQYRNQIPFQTINIQNSNNYPNFNPQKNSIEDKNSNIRRSSNNLVTNMNNNVEFNNLQYQKQNINSNIRNNIPEKIPENSSNDNNNPNEKLIGLNSSEINDDNNPNKNSKLLSSLLYGLIIGSFGTLLLWCKNPEVRNYLKECYRNINSETLKNFFKSFLHPIDLFKSLGSNFKNALKQSLNFLYRFIEEYNDLWRLLGVIVMIYVLWLIIKMIIRKLGKSHKKKKKVRKNEHYDIAH